MKFIFHVGIKVASTEGTASQPGQLLGATVEVECHVSYLSYSCPFAPKCSLLVYALLHYPYGRSVGKKGPSTPSWLAGSLWPLAFDPLFCRAGSAHRSKKDGSWCVEEKAVNPAFLNFPTHCFPPDLQELPFHQEG